MTSPKPHRIAIKTTASKFLSYFAEACASKTSSSSSDKNTLLICCTKQKFIRLLLEEYGEAEGSVAGSIASVVRSHRSNEEAEQQQQSPRQVRRVPSVILDSQADDGELSSRGSVRSVVRSHNSSEGERPQVKEEEEQQQQEEAVKEEEQQQQQQQQQQQPTPQKGRFPSEIPDSEGEDSEISSLSSRSPPQPPPVHRSRTSSASQVAEEDWPPSPPHQVFSSQISLRIPPPSSSPEQEPPPPPPSFAFSPTLSTLAIATSVHNVFFAPTLPHIRAFLSTYKNTGTLGIYNILPPHNPLEQSVQGLSRTLASAVDASTNLIIGITTEEASTMLKLANVGMGMFDKKNKSVNVYRDGFDRDDDDGNEGSLEERWTVSAEDVLGRWVEFV